MEYHKELDVKNLQLKRLKDWVKKLDKTTPQRQILISEIGIHITKLEGLLKEAKNKIFSNDTNNTCTRYSNNRFFQSKKVQHEHATNTNTRKRRNSFSISLPRIWKKPTKL